MLLNGDSPRSHVEQGSYRSLSAGLRGSRKQGIPSDPTKYAKAITNADITLDAPVFGQFL